MTDLELIECEVTRLDSVLSPSPQNDKEYKHGWTNGKKFALARVLAYINKLKTIEREGDNAAVESRT